MGCELCEEKQESRSTLCAAGRTGTRAAACLVQSDAGRDEEAAEDGAWPKVDWNARQQVETAVAVRRAVNEGHNVEAAA